MLVRLGENGVKTLEDLGDCASDDLVGWTDGDVAKPGFLSGFDVSRAQADAMILDARVRAGWIEAPAPEEEHAGARRRRRGRRVKGRRGRSIADFERRIRVGADLHHHGDQGRS